MFLNAPVLFGNLVLPHRLWWSLRGLPGSPVASLSWSSWSHMVITVIFPCLEICAAMSVSFEHVSRPGHIGQGCSLEAALRPFATIGTKCPGWVCGI